ncbi:MAG: hypothetical protein HWN65_18860 [Candidatus Helarchaeota archaeon]|nr:hypothetical protein [Candidatus Helarchaeota archaeon]
MPIPTSWVATYSNITVINVTKDSDILAIEEDQSSYADAVEGDFGMSFDIISSAMLYNFSFYSTNVWKVLDVLISVYNATQQGAYPAPDSLLYNETYGAPGSTGWNTYSFASPIKLEAINTYANTFFIVIDASPDGPFGNLRWAYEVDGPGDDHGYAFEYQAPAWILRAWDFTLRVGLRNNSRSPSAVDLRINGTSVTDKDQINGSWASTFEFSNTTLNFQFSANSSAYFLVDYFVTYSQTNTHVVSTTFEGLDSSAIVWNASYDADFLADSFGKRLEFSLPPWELATNVWKDSGQHSLWTSNSSGSKRTVTISNAENGTWTVQCNDTNYVESVYVKRSGIPVSEINSTDTIEIYGNFTEILTTGDANLTIFPLVASYNDTFGEGITTNKTIKFSPLWTPTDTSTGSFTSAALQVAWCNGTSAGIKTSNLTVNNIPTNLTYKSHTSNVDSGDSIFVFVNYSNAYTGEPLIDADLLVKNSTDGKTWPAPFQIADDYLNGTYKIEILTFGVIGGTHYLSVNISKPLYLSSEISDISVTIGGGISNINITAPNCRGLDSNNQTYALANPAPYHNSTVKVTIFYYDNQTLDPLKNGIISGSWLGGGPPVSWVPAFFGYYNITIDVTGFHSGTNHTLEITIQQAGYVPAVLYIIVPTRKLPTRIHSLEPNYSGYLYDTLVISAIFHDTHHDESIPSIYQLHGNCTIRIGNFYDNMTLLTPSIGIYQYVLDLTALVVQEDQIYDITVFAFSSEHEFATVNVSLYIIPRKEVNLICLAVPEYILAGSPFTTHALLTDILGKPIPDTPLTCKWIFQPGFIEIQKTQLTNGSGIAEFYTVVLELAQSVQIEIEYLGNKTTQNKTVISPFIPIIRLNRTLTLSPLPNELMEGETIKITANLLINGTPAVDKKITFTFAFEGLSEIEIRVVLTDSYGQASAELLIPSGVSKIYIDTYFAGSGCVNACRIESEIIVITYKDLFFRALPVLVLCLLVTMGSTLTYNYVYKRPKVKRLNRKLHLITQNFEDTMNLNFLMVIMAGSGLTIYNYSFKGEEFDYQLMGGFLSAISSFQAGIGKPGKITGLEKGEWEIKYQSFKIYGINREYTQYVVILNDSASDSLKSTLHEFVIDIDKRYSYKFAKFDGETSVFDPIDSLVQKHFDTHWLMKHVSSGLFDGQEKPLTLLERKLYNLGKSLTQ